MFDHILCIFSPLLVFFSWKAFFPGKCAINLEPKKASSPLVVNLGWAGILGQKQQTACLARLRVVKIGKRIFSYMGNRSLQSKSRILDYYLFLFLNNSWISSRLIIVLMIKVALLDLYKI